MSSESITCMGAAAENWHHESRAIHLPGSHHQTMGQEHQTRLKPSKASFNPLLSSSAFGILSTDHQGRDHGTDARWIECDGESSSTTAEIKMSSSAGPLASGLSQTDPDTHPPLSSPLPWNFYSSVKNMDNCDVDLNIRNENGFAQNSISSTMITRESTVRTKLCGKHKESRSFKKHNSFEVARTEKRCHRHSMMNPLSGDDKLKRNEIKTPLSIPRTKSSFTNMSTSYSMDIYRTLPSVSSLFLDDTHSPLSPPHTPIGSNSEFNLRIDNCTPSSLNDYASENARLVRNPFLESSTADSIKEGHLFSAMKNPFMSTCDSKNETEVSSLSDNLSPSSNLSKSNISCTKIVSTTSTTCASTTTSSSCISLVTSASTIITTTPTATLSTPSNSLTKLPAPSADTDIRNEKSTFSIKIFKQTFGSIFSIGLRPHKRKLSRIRQKALAHYHHVVNNSGYSSSRFNDDSIIEHRLSVTAENSFNGSR